MIRPERAPATRPPAGPLRRVGWLFAGLACVAIGAIGVVVPGLPTTVFFIGAAAAFARSSPRLEAWVLSLPKVGPLVRDHRDGLGMPRRAKVLAVSMIIVAVAVSTVFIDGWIVRGVVVAAGLVGVVVVLRQPTAGFDRTNEPMGGSSHADQ